MLISYSNLNIPNLYSLFITVVSAAVSCVHWSTVHEIYVLMAAKIFLGGDAQLANVILCKVAHSYIFMTITHHLGFGQKKFKY